MGAPKKTESGECFQAGLGLQGGPGSQPLAEHVAPEHDPKAEAKALAPPPPPPVSEPPAPRKPRRKEPSPTDLAAYAILRAAEPIVFANVPGIAMTRERWRAANKAAAVGFVELGDWPPERVVALLRFAYTNPEAAAFYGQTTMLAKFAEAAPRLALIRDGRTAAGRSNRRPERAMNLALR